MIGEDLPSILSLVAELGTSHPRFVTVVGRDEPARSLISRNTSYRPGGSFKSLEKRNSHPCPGVQWESPLVVQRFSNPDSPVHP